MLLRYENLIMNKLVALHVLDDDHNLKETLFDIRVLDLEYLILLFQKVLLLFQDDQNEQISLKLSKNKIVHGLIKFKFKSVSSYNSFKWLNIFYLTAFQYSMTVVFCPLVAFHLGISYDHLPLVTLR